MCFPVWPSDSARRCERLVRLDSDGKEEMLVAKPEIFDERGVVQSSFGLGQLRPPAPMGPSDHKLRRNQALYKPGFVEVVGILVEDSEFGSGGLHAVKPGPQRL